MVKSLDSRQFIRRITLGRDRVPSFDHYPFSIPAIHGLSTLRLDSPVTMFVGENGSGKSTLLEAIAVAWGFNAEGGSVNFNFSTRASHSSLLEFLRLERGLQRPKDGFFLRAESFYNVASEIERLDAVPGLGTKIGAAYGARSLHEQSHGESFLSLIMERFRGNGLYILDEPEAALSPTRQMALLVRIHDLVAAGSQFIIATHSPILLAYPTAAIWSLEVDGLKQVEYESTEHYQVSRRFLLDHHRVVGELLDGGSS
ncbi:MAG TPA: AAA family ATPase [Longimicrobiales bacterium]|nr:AAA family ATPase [Longimicrobiales bacterium]